mmetsp:Transcript_46925/g.109697  ORF Transcript_46925/g.109697 Transcript_46925/m.109697 type:complete len:259 (+) Transcript_46925:1653-2429(+)
MAQMPRHDLNLVVSILVWSAQFEVLQFPARERCCALQEVILPPPALHRARRGLAVAVGEVGKLTHEVAPVDHLPIQHLRLLARELRSPEELDRLVRDMVAGSRQGIRELILADGVVALRVHFAKRLAQCLPVRQEAVNKLLGHETHVALLGFSRRAAHGEPGAVDEICELLVGHRALRIAIDGLHQHVALLVIHFDAHLVEDLLQVSREDVARLLQRASPEHIHQPRPPGVALPNDLPDALHSRHRVGIQGRRVVEVR